MLCPQCGQQMRLLKGDKFWVHDGVKQQSCSIPSIPNSKGGDSESTEALIPLPQSDPAYTEIGGCECMYGKETQDGSTKNSLPFSGD